MPRTAARPRCCRRTPMENGRQITGLVRGNFILNERADKASVADRNHKAYPVLDPNSAENVMTVRDDPIGKGQVIPRAREAYEINLKNFRAMMAPYPQVLTSQRTLFQTEVEYARALIQLRERAVGLRGFLLQDGLDPIMRSSER